MHDPWSEENAGNISEDVVLVIHQMIRAISWRGGRVNKNERMLQKMGQSNMVTHWKHMIKEKKSNDNLQIKCGKWKKYGFC